MNRVMRRVHTIHMLQPIFTSTTLSIGVFVVALWGIGREVWVARVFQNEPSITNLANLGALAHFYLSAFLDTRFIVQALSILALGALVWFVYTSVRSLKVGSMLSFATA